MNAQNIANIHKMWQILCPEEFKSILPSSLFTTKPHHNHRTNYPDIYILKKLDTTNYQRPAVERAISVESIIKLLQSMITTNDKLVCAKQMPHFNNIDRDNIRTAGGHEIIAISKKGILFLFEYDFHLQKFSRIIIADLRYESKSFSKSFINILDSYLEYIVTTTRFSHYYEGYTRKLDRIPEFNSVFVTLIVLISAYMSSRDQSTQQQIIKCRQSDKQQSLRLIESISHNLKEFANYNQQLKKNRQQYLKSLSQKASQALKEPTQLLNRSFDARMKEFTQSHQKLSKKQQQSVNKLLQVVQRIKAPLPTVAKQQIVQQGYFQKQENRLKQMEQKLKQKQKALEQKEKQLIDLPEYFTDVAGDLGIIVDPVVADDGFTYSRRTAENIIRNRLNGRAGTRIRSMKSNHDLKKALNQFKQKYQQVQDGRYKRKNL
jgi:hypothetical protein